jgi:phosphoesterase RecJ-like protein
MAGRIETSHKIVVITHRSPDGDAIGSALAMYEVLKIKGKSCKVFCVDPWPESFYFLPNNEELTHELRSEDFDLAIVLDCGATYMTDIHESHANMFYGHYPLINIDHHPSNDNFGRWNLVDTNAASTTAILTHIFHYLNWKITPSIATCLMTGLYTDTGSLKHSNASSDVHRIAGQLLRSGARLKDIVKYVFKTTKVERLRLWGRVMKRISQTADNITISTVSDQDFTETGTTKPDLEGVVDYLNAVPNAKFSLLLTEIGGKVKGSLRTMREDIDLTKVAEKLGGGGHKKASGFTIPGKLRLQTRFEIISEEGEKFEDALLGKT